MALVLSAACSEREPSVSDSWSDVCIDADGDGHGFQCADGNDCDDDDPSQQTRCAACQKPEQGCACDNDAPVDCRLPHLLDPSGGLLCRQGTRYCRANSWSACEGVASFLVPASPRLTARGLIDQDAAPVICDPCNPDCYRVEDPLVTPPGLDVGPNLAPAVGGGVTLASLLPNDAGAFNGLLDDAPCAPDDADCDGLPDAYDPEPASAPAGHRFMVMDLAQGAAASQSFESSIQLASADIYFYLDATSFMEGVRDQLLAELSSGNFLPDAGLGLECADTDADGAPDQALKTAGITGNLTCLLRDARFGAGWFRDIPFAGPFDANGATVAPWDYEMFEHRQDITADIASLRTALLGFATRPNLNVPEGSMQGLWALATGGELYAGWDRSGIAARRGCPPGTWGYACFRTGSLPIIFHITDAPMQNGPSTPARTSTDPATPPNCLSDALESSPGIQCDPLEYDPGVLGDMHAGSEGTYRALTGAAEDFSSAEQVGAIDGVLITYVGSTEAMNADLVYDEGLFIACPEFNAWSPTLQDSPDAVFRFRVEAAGDYLLSARGSRFDTTLMLLQTDVSGTPIGAITCADDNLWLDGEPGQRGDTAEIQIALPPGDYAVVLKGYRSSAWGQFQLSLGDRTRETPTSFQAQRWLGPAGDGSTGIRRVLNERAMRVVTLQSSADWYAAQQSQALASATAAVAASGAPLTFQIGADGSGLGSSVVEAVRQLTDNLALDVSLVLAQTPDNPGRDFELRVEAVDQSGDGCEPPIDRDGDAARVPDTHVQCQPGATPRFQVTFRNPAAPNDVPPNASDPTGRGGYRMALQVVGDGSLVLDRVPVYIVPADVVADPPPTMYPPVGHYQQEVPARGCNAGEGAVWRVLDWNATMPPGTRLTFEICSGDTDEELAQCNFQQAVELQAGASCSAADDCGAAGYCDVSGVCHRVTGPSCMLDEDCGVRGTCVATGAGSVCSSARNAIDLKPAAIGLQGRQRALVRVGLYANTDRTQAPTIRNWQLDYTCAPQE
jgi:hypothetical protein